jgi:hypothetical protein
MLAGKSVFIVADITKHVIALCGQNVELLNFETGGTCRNHWTLKESFES